MRPIRYTDEMIDEFRRDGYWTDEVFTDFWERNAKELGDREALVDSKYRVTWKQAWRLLNNLAYAWVKLGIPKDSRIIIQAPNSVYGFIARIAADRAGLISLTVYPYLREKELTYMVEKTEAVAVAIPHIYRRFNYLDMYKELKKTSPYLKYLFLFEEEVPDGAPEGSYSLIKLANEDVDESKYKELDARRFSSYYDVGLLTSTTGTTGLPKLVEWPIASRVCTSKARVDIWRLTKDDITVAIAPHAGGAAGTLTYFAAPLVGAKTVMMEEFEPEGALKLIEKERATAIGVVPTHLVRMLEVDETKYDLSSLRFIRSAGGYLPPQVAEEAERRYKAIITSDLGTQDVGSVSGCTIDDPGEIRRRTVGRMLPGNKVRLLDDNGNEVKEGEPGQLW
ncbi:MAG: AMP-binding protein, partial [Syntrophorhabdaceae bacterium]|nr:AMP-binding protein [Syntrophorhabdaceae bacterium]